MDLNYTASEISFRDEVRSWLSEQLPKLPLRPDRHDWPARREFDTGWQKSLFEAGYAGLHWPTEAGGRGATATEHLIFLEESERAGAPYVGVNFVGLLHAGPTLITEASDALKSRHLPPILRGDHVWCQGFSEPGAGSDLASLSTRAEVDGDHYVVNGQKIWTSFAQVADYCELLIRTDSQAPKHKGISWVVLDMKSPGIEVRPLRTIGGSSEFNEMFLTDVRVPIAERVGPENDGWRVAMVTFSFERGTAFVGELLRSRELLKSLGEGARRMGLDDDGVKRELGHLTADLDALWALTKRNVTQSSRGAGVPGLLGSVFKLHYTEVRHRMGDLAMSLLGRSGLTFDDVGGNSDHVEGWLHAMSLSIAAGTSQIQRNIVGERMLGLPKEPR